MPVTDVGDGNPVMVAAIAKAKATLGDFVAVLQQPRREQGGFAVKYPVKKAPGSEHVWVSDVRYSDGSFVGRLGNDPIDSPLRFGDPVTIPRDDVSDWMYLENGRLAGGYTIRAMQRILPPEEWNELNRTAPFLID